MTTTNPINWEAPTWHPDFGNPTVEVEMLRAFCIKAIERFPNLTTALLTPEEGYLHVEVNKSSKKLAEIHIVSDEANQRFGIFGFDGGDESGEQYFLENDEGLRILEKMLR